MTKAFVTRLPLLFSFTHVVVGNGFVAGVRTDGRALLEHEEVDGATEIWISGVSPVGVSGGGKDRGTAFHEFRRAWLEVLFDFAAEAKSFADFRALCASFLTSTQTDLTGLWDDAVTAVRSQGYSDPTLPTGRAEQPVNWAVEDLSAMQALANSLDGPWRQVAA